ncbi:hypothetical protein ABPG75_002563 [Micractinium tetrahymenae]
MPNAPVLALPGPLHCYRYDGDFCIAGIPINGRGTGWAVWDGAPTAANFLEAAAAELRRRQPALASVLELGSGTGLAGLAAAAALQLPTLLTDLPEVLPALQKNIAANPGLAALVSAAPLDWRQPHSRSSAVDALLFGQLTAAGFQVEAAPPLPGEPDRGPIDIYWLTPLHCEGGKAGVTEA